MHFMYDNKTKELPPPPAADQSALAAVTAADYAEEDDESHEFRINVTELETPRDKVVLDDDIMSVATSIESTEEEEGAAKVTSPAATVIHLPTPPPPVSRSNRPRTFVSEIRQPMHTSIKTIIDYTHCTLLY